MNLNVTLWAQMNNTLCKMKINNHLQCNRAALTWVSKAICICFSFALLRLMIAVNPMPLSQPIRSKTKPNHDMLTHVFPSLMAATCICSEFWLVHWIVCVLWLLWFWCYRHSIEAFESKKDKNPLYMVELRFLKPPDNLDQSHFPWFYISVKHWFIGLIASHCNDFLN